MSIFIHRCNECGHKDIDHAKRDGDCSFGWCPRRCMKSQPAVRREAPAEVMATYSEHGQESLVPIEPGTQWGEQMGGFVDLCNCAGCRDLYSAAVAS